MEELNKQQLILLALLVSFVTSIATGIVVVALLQGAPGEVKQTIDRVIERTIRPEKITEQVVVRDMDLVKKVVSENTQSLVTFFEQTNGVKKEIPISGFLIKDDGTIVTMRSIVPYVEVGNVVVKYKNIFFNARLLPVPDTGEASFIKITSPIVDTDGILIKNNFFKSLTPASKEKIVLGSSVIGLDSTGDVQIATGIISRIKNSGVPDKDGVLKDGGVQYVYTNFGIGASSLGGPALLLDGTVAGMIVSEKDAVSTVLSSEKIQEALSAVLKTGTTTEAKK